MSISYSVVMVGLQGCGKSTILASLTEDKQQIYPTAGFQIKEVMFGSIPQPVLVYDCSGCGQSRQNWWVFFSYVNAVIFVIDSIDVDRFFNAKQKLIQISKNQILRERKLPLCIMLNKHQKTNVKKQIYTRGLQIQKIRNCFSDIYIKQTSGFKKEGLLQSFEWIYQKIKRS